MPDAFLGIAKSPVKSLRKMQQSTSYLYYLLFPEQKQGDKKEIT